MGSSPIPPAQRVSSDPQSQKEKKTLLATDKKIIKEIRVPPPEGRGALLGTREAPPVPNLNKDKRRIEVDLKRGSHRCAES